MSRASERVRITHPEKILFPDDGISKGDLAAHYELVAPLMIPHVRGRPITMERFPSGIGTKGFIQKDVSRGFPEWLPRVEVPKKGGTVHHVLAEDTRSLQWIVNQNTITLHVWTSRVPRLRQPDICVFDLDPPDDGSRDDLRDAALQLRDLLAERGHRSWVKTSGSKGFHIVVTWPGDDGDGRMTSRGAAMRFANGMARELVERDPSHLTLEFSKADRKKRIYVDTGRNGHSATIAAPYAVRARGGAPVSAPCTWEEVEQGITPRAFTVKNMKRRIQAVGDLWREML